MITVRRIDWGWGRRAAGVDERGPFIRSYAGSPGNRVVSSTRVAAVKL